nr:alpha/beta hydrolase [Notoacmeibacter sp. MSK16QG-6]
MLHEMGGSVESWDLVLPHLPESCTVVIPEMRGMGMSEEVRAPFNFRDLASDVEQLIAFLGIDGPVVSAGVAVGGAVALRLALDRPERYRTTIALGPAAGTPEEKRKPVRQIADSLEADGMRAAEAILLDRTYPSRYRERNPEHFAKVRGRWLANKPASFAAYFRALADTEMRSELPHLQGRIIFASGTDDVFRPPAYVADLAAITPGAEYAELDAGHHLADHASVDVANLIAQCLPTAEQAEKA